MDDYINQIQLAVSGFSSPRRTHSEVDRDKKVEGFSPTFCLKSVANCWKKSLCFLASSIIFFFSFTSLLKIFAQLSGLKEARGTCERDTD